jgi:hypothetical protein
MDGIFLGILIIAAIIFIILYMKKRGIKITLNNTRLPRVIRKAMGEKVEDCDSN